MAPDSTSIIKLGSQNLKNGLDPAIQATALMLAIRFSKLKTNVLRERDTNSRDRSRLLKQSLQSVYSSKIYIGLGQKRKRIKSLEFKGKKDRG